MKSNRKYKRSFTVIATVAIVMMYSLVSPFINVNMASSSDNFVHALTVGRVTATSTGAEDAIQGDTGVEVTFLIENGLGEKVEVSNMELTMGGTGLTVSENTGTVSIPSGGSQSVSFSVDVANKAAIGENTATFSADLEGSANQSEVTKNFTFQVYEKLSTDLRDSSIVAALNISHSIVPSDGFTKGNGNKLKLELYNYGNTTLKNAKVAITLPEGLSIYNASNMASLGYIAVGESKTVEFPITVDSGIESKNYAIEVEFLGLDYMSDEATTTKTFYVPVNSDGSFAADNIQISNVSIPAEMPAGQNFNLSFDVKNTGTSEASSLKIMVEPEEGIINKSRNIFVAKLAAGESKNYSVNFYTFDGATQKSYPIKITASPTTSSSESESTDIATQYATIMITSSGSGAKTPQLMIDNYTYGGSNVQAGSDFILNLGLLNTSGKTLTNVKVSITTEEGTFVPTDSSNSFFIDEIKAKSHYTKSIRLTAKPDAVEKTTAITVSMKYEDTSQNPYESSDIISVPVTQETRLVIDELVPPTEVYMGEAGTCELQFYNMGKTVLNNLRVNADGNFDTMESNSYFAGNMEKGKSDSYRFSFIPREVGTMEGVITFSFEDANGDPQYQEVPFSFEVMDMPVFEEDLGLEEDADKKVPWSLIIAGAVVALAVIGIIVFKRIRKKKMNNALEIEDDYDISLRDDVEAMEGDQNSEVNATAQDSNGEREDAVTDRQDTKADNQ